jgi:acyltransferase family protein
LDEYRPYYDNEVPEAVARIASDSLFEPIVRYVFPNEDYKGFVDDFRRIASVDDFQAKVMDKAIGNIVRATAADLSYSGIDLIDPKKSYTYISNHRDIVLDSAILQTIFYANNIKTSEITFGSNLMRPQIVVDIGKINKMFKIIRGGTAKEIFVNSQNVSDYMRYAITHKNESTWIAQRNGRTKDGDDKTQVAVVKMLAMSSDKPFADNLAEMNIAPIAVSYEYEPCDILKTREIYLSRKNGSYTKTANEDINSIITGVTQYKGRIHYTICPPIEADELARYDSASHNEKFRLLAQDIDRRIYRGYRLFPNNYIAFDLLANGSDFDSEYTHTQREAFISYTDKALSLLEGDREELRNIFLGIYANPVGNVVNSK